MPFPRALLTALPLLLLASAAQAQFLPPGVAPAAQGQAEPAATPEAGAEATAASDAQALIGVLQDEAARARLIGELEAIAAGDGEPGDDPAAEATEEPPPDEAPSLGQRITAAVPALIGDVVRNLDDVWTELRATGGRLGGYARLDTTELRRILLDVAPVAAAAIAAYLVARRLMAPLFRRLGGAADRARILRTTLIGAAAVLLDAGTVLLGVAAGALVIGVSEVADDLAIAFRIVFLMSFLITGGLLVAIRAVFSPGTRHLRPLPVGDAGARYWSARLGLLAIVLTFGEIFVQGLVAETVSELTARGTLVLIYMATGVYLFYLVLVNRHAPAAYFEARAAENDEDITFSIIAAIVRYWHWAALAFLLALMHQVVTSGGGALPLVFAATQIVAAFAIGALLIALIAQAGHRGVRLPARLNQSMPAMEGRINAFAPAFLRLLRFVVLILWVAFTLQVVGILDLRAWLELRIGVDVLGAAASVLLIVLVAFVVWLALSSWVDYRLEPRRGQAATSRERTLVSLMRNAGTVVILLIALMSVLSELGISIAPLLASAGVLGLAIGFGAQKMVEDIIGGAFIQFENSVNVGDVVTAAGTTGVVEAMTIRSLGLRDLQGAYHVIPFSAISTVSNLTKGFGYHVADIGIAYRENIDEAKAEMLAAYDALRSDPEIGHMLIGDLEWFGIEAFADSSVTLRARLKTWPGEQWTLGRAYNEQVKRRFDAAGIEIAFPQLTLWFGELKDGTAPPARVVRDGPGHAAAPAAQAPPESRAARIPPGSPTDAPDDAGGEGEGPER